MGEGFTLSAILFRGLPDFAPLRTCPYSAGCNPGTLVDFSTSYSGPIVGWQVFTAPSQLSPPDFSTLLYSGDITVSGPTLAVPTATEAIVSVTAPFTFTGTLTANSISGSYDAYELGPLLFTTTLSGRGTAELRMSAWHCP